MSSSLTAAIDRSDVASANLLSRARRMVEQARGLGDDQRQKLPVFRGSWDAEHVEDYVGRLQEALRSPVVYQSRQFLLSRGIRAERVPTEQLEDAVKVQQLVTLLDDLGDMGDYAKPALAHWLMDAELGLDHAVERLSAVDRTELISIGETKLSKELKASYMRAAFEGARAATSQAANALATALAVLHEYQVKVPSRGITAHDLEEPASRLRGNIEQLEDRYSMPTATLKAVLKGKSLVDALDVTTREVSLQMLEFENLSAQWNALADGLAAVGEHRPESSPRTIGALRSGVADLEQRLEDLIGTAGRKLLDFFHETADFPSDLGLDDIRAGLITLRPLIAKGIRKP